MKIPFQNFKKKYVRYRRAIDATFGRVCKRGHFILGPELAAFEKEFARATKTRYAVGVNSGTDALILAMRALDIGSGDTVITVANTFVATAMAIQSVGATPIFVDVDPTTGTMDVSLLERLIDRKTKAIMPVHLYGYPADIQAIKKIAKKHKLYIIEDACQAHSACFRGNPVGSIGDVGCFSFYPTKNMGAFGDAGAITTNNVKIATRIRGLRNYGESRKYTSDILGVNSRMDELQAALLRWSLRQLPVWNKKRAQLASRYTEQLKDLSIQLPPESDSQRQRVWHLYVIRCAVRNQLQAFLKKRGIATMVHYPIPIYAQPAFSYLKCSAQNYPNTAKVTREILSLPLYPEMSFKEVDVVCAAIREFFEKVI